MNKPQFIDRLLADFRGLIVVCNILDGLNERMYEESFVQQFFDWWLSLYVYEGCGSINKMLATMSAIVFNNGYKGFRSGTPKPDFRLICCRNPRLNSVECELTTVIPVFVFKNIMSRNDLKRLISQGVEFPSDVRHPWVSEALDSLMELPDANRYISLGAGRTIGRENSLVWFTKKDHLDKILSKNMDHADRTRDSLGLVHRKSGDIMIALHFSNKVLKYIISGRPIFSDAGVHRRFKALADKTSNRRRSAWGYTTDLKSFADKKRYLDGLPERVANPIDENAMVEEPKIKFTPLGVVKQSRGNTADDNDECFANRLMNGRNIPSIKNEILNVL